MFDFYQRRKIKTFLLAPLTRFVLFVLAGLMIWAAYTRYEKAEGMEERRKEAEQQVEELKIQKQQMEERVKYLSNERGIEAEMRRQFDVALPNEQVVVIVEPESEKNERNASSTTYQDSEEPAWYEFWR